MLIMRSVKCGEDPDVNKSCIWGVGTGAKSSLCASSGQCSPQTGCLRSRELASPWLERLQPYMQVLAGVVLVDGPSLAHGSHLLAAPSQSLLCGV